MAHLDYIVVTCPVNDAVEAHMPRVMRLVRGGSKTFRNGYSGDAVPGAFVGYRPLDNTVMLQYSGTSTETYISKTPDVFFDGASIARLDIQRTVAVSEDADTYVRNVFPRRKYKSTLITTVNGTGATLYIGSPTSRARMRIYNKTAESGIQSFDGRDLLRVELQLRDKYADQAFKHWRAGKADVVLASALQRMVDSSTPNRVWEALDIREPEIPIHLTVADEMDALARRKWWIEACVMPAIKKLLVADPGYMEHLTNLLQGVIVSLDAERHVTGAEV